MTSNPCGCKRCRDSRQPTWWLSPSQLQELLLSGACPTCGTFTCPHALDCRSMCVGPVPSEPLPGVEIQWFTYLDGTYVLDSDNS